MSCQEQLRHLEACNCSLCAERNKIIFHLCPSGSFSSSLSLYPCVPPLYAPSLSPSLFPPSLFFSLRHGPPLSFPLAFISFVFPFPLGPQLHAPLVPLAAAQLCRGVTCSLLLCPQVHCPRGHCPRGHPQTAQPWDAPPEINACCCLALSPS